MTSRTEKLITFLALALLWLAVTAFGQSTRPVRLPLEVDDGPSIQRAVNHGIATGDVVKLDNPDGYKWVRPIIIAGAADGTGGNPLVSVVIEGRGGTPLADKSGRFKGTICRPMGDAGFVIQGGRAVIFRYLAMIGKYNPPLKRTAEGVGQLIDDAAWAAPPGVRDSRYSPYAAFVIDFTSGKLPPDKGYPSLRGQYTRYSTKSSDIQFERVTTNGFVSGYVLDPSGGDTMTSEIVLRRVNIGDCKIGISTCKSQSRNVRVEDAQIQFCRRAFSGIDHGAQNGPPPIIAGGNIGNCGTVLAFNGNAPIDFSNVYGEANVSLLEGGSTHSPAMSVANLNNCHLSFMPQPGKPILEATMDVHVNGGAWDSFGPMEFKTQRLLTFANMVLRHHGDLSIAEAFKFPTEPAWAERVRMNQTRVVSGRVEEYRDGWRGGN